MRAASVIQADTLTPSAAAAASTFPWTSGSTVIASFGEGFPRGIQSILPVEDTLRNGARRGSTGAGGRRYDGRMANPNAGRFVWHEIMSKDIGAALKFYTAMFGWTVQEMDMGPAGKYHLLMKGKDAVGGGMQSPPGAPSHWMTSVGAADCDAAVTKITELGGKVLVPPTTVPDMVRFAVAMDPQGAAFGVVQGLGPSKDIPPYDGPPRPGFFCWDELHTSDVEAAQKFYSALFGWTGKTGEGAMKYWHWQNAGKDIGGMMKLMMPNVPPNWLAYLAVVDVDAETKKTKELGGKVMMEPMEIEKVGKFSVVQDPTGATFALFRSARV